MDSDSFTYDSSSQQKSESSSTSIEKEMPNFTPSGILLEYYGNKRNGVVLKFSEPLDAAVPNPEKGDKEWCFFEFKDDMLVNEGKDPFLLNEKKKSAFLFGQDPEPCDFVMHHPSISGQHCVV